MKKFFREIISTYLRGLSKLELAKSHKQIIAITGSIGKTTTKAATVEVLSSKFQVDQTSGNFNTDFGLMLSILKQNSGGSSPLKWCKAIIGATGHLLFKHKKYQKLVLEMAVDKPGDMDDSLKVANPDISILTTIAPVHMEKGQFKDTKDIFREKSKLIRSMKKGIAILNYDDPLIRSLKTERLKCKLLWFGTFEKKDELNSLPPGLYATDIKETRKGLTFKITSTYNPISTEAGSTTAYETHNLKTTILGPQHVYSILPAIIVGLQSGLSLKASCKALENFQLPPGRLNLIPGINKSTIIDSSYNSSPDAVVAALKTLWNYPSQRKIAVLGNMNELGTYTEKAHSHIGQIVPKYAQYLITVGKTAQLIAHEAANHGMPTHLIKSFNLAEEAGAHLQKILRHDDVVLLKGSQNGVFLERAIKMIMKEPEKAKSILVRQSKKYPTP